jgi:hypothetical protein
VQVDAGDQVVIQGWLQLDDDSFVIHPVSGSGVAYTVHFDPAH